MVFPRLGAAFLCCVVILGLSVGFTLASESFEAFPLLKYNRQGANLASRKSALNSIAGSYHQAYDEGAIRSKVILLPYQVPFVPSNHPPALTTSLLGVHPPHGGLHQRQHP